MSDVMQLRLEMAAEGWDSEDRLTEQGWGGTFGYSIWFQRWNWHGRKLITLTGNKACYHAHTPNPLGPSDFLRVATLAAERARKAYAGFPDVPPRQMADNTLQVMSLPEPPQ